jgi:hypothetical protein
MSLLPWLLFFASWFIGLRWATSHAFPEPIFKPKPGEDLGPLYLPSILFHGSLVLAMIGVLVTVLIEDIRALWLAVPGSALPIFIGCWIEYQFIVERRDNPLHLSPFWLESQWPFILLSLALSGMGVGWTIAATTPFPLLFVGYSAFFLFQYWFFYSHCNGVTISHLTFETSANFPRLYEVGTSTPRPKSLHLSAEKVNRWHRKKLWRVVITREDEEPMEIVSKISWTQQIRIEEEFGETLSG